MIKIESNSVCPIGKAYTMSQDDKQNIILRTISNGKMVQYTAVNTMGTWKELNWKQDELECFEDKILNMNGATDDTVVKYELILIHKEHSVKIIKLPQEGSVYSLRTPYRIYHGYDSKRTYMNVADSWQLFATLHHDELLEHGKRTHAEIDIAIDTIVSLREQVKAQQAQIKELDTTLQAVNTILEDFVVKYPPEEG